MLIEYYGPNSKRHEKEQLAHAIIDLFPTYRVNNSEIGGIVRKIILY